MHVLETERLILRRITSSDAAMLLELMNDPAFIEPFVGTTKGGTKYGASVWTAPQTPVGSLASQIYQQNNGWFGFGITFIWDSTPPTAARPAAAPAR